MDNGDIVKTIREIKECSQNKFQECISEVVKEAVDEQRYNDIIKTIVILCDVGVKEQDIYQLLAEFWGIDNRCRASEYITIGKTIEFPCKRLKAYLKENGFDNISIVSFMKKHSVREKLRNDPKLCELTVEELKSAVEKNNI